MGVFEMRPYEAGTRGVAERSHGQGGRVRRGRRRLGRRSAPVCLEDEVTFVSTGGGASMQLLEGTPLPGVEALLDR